MSNWDNFWKNKGKNMEWGKEDILNSRGLKELSQRILENTKKSNIAQLKTLELGSGMGLTSYFFASNGADVTLVDMSKDAGKMTKEFYGKTKYKFVCADVFKLKLKEKYDAILSFGLCEHFTGEQRTKMLEKHLEFLSKEGIAIISVPHKYGIFYRMYKSLAQLLGLWSFGLEIPFSKKEFIQFANSHNLKYEIIASGFYSSGYDLFFRKPLKILKIPTKRRFDNTKSIFDRYFGAGLVCILYQNK